jgi:hypothetical protein
MCVNHETCVYCVGILCIPKLWDHHMGRRIRQLFLNVKRQILVFGAYTQHMLSHVGLVRRDVFPLPCLTVLLGMNWMQYGLERQIPL